MAHHNTVNTNTDTVKKMLVAMVNLPLPQQYGRNNTRNRVTC